MSRRISRFVDVQCSAKGVPLFIHTGRASLPIREVVDDWREWFGAIFGEPERDVWIVDTPKGIYELHHVGYSPDKDAEKAQGEWIMERVED